MRRLHLFILFLILLVGLFFRLYQAVERLEFAHDGDLYSWIVKDIVIDHHFRLIGQLTSAPGIFIGALFYYLLIPFFLLSKMDPVGVIFVPAIMGSLTILSYFIVLSRLFKIEVGLIAAFLYAILLSTIGFDRWIVPTLLTKIWAIWYLYCLLMIYRRNFSVLPLLAILIGLIWHIHIALAPTLIAIPIALFLSKKLPKKKEVILFLVLLVISSLPLIIFEMRHNFSQSKSFFRNFTASFGSGKSISETRDITLNKEINYAAQNLDPSTKFTLEVTPNILRVGDQVFLKITTKNPKYSTMTVRLDCGNPQQFEIGSISGEFSWSTAGCSEGVHKISTFARIPKDPIWRVIIGKFLNVLEKENRNIQDLFLLPLSLPIPIQYLFTFIILFSPFIAFYLKVIDKQQMTIFYSWIMGVIIFFTFSSIIVSEYYLSSIEILLIFIISLILSKVYKNGNFGKFIVFTLLLLLFVKNFVYFIAQENNKKGYKEKNSVVQYIAADIERQNFPCIKINFITNIGDNVGFRYFFWLYNIKIVKTEQSIPEYFIVLPYELAENNIDQKFGHIGVIPPTTIPNKEIMEKACQAPNTNLTDPMFGYVD